MNFDAIIAVVRQYLDGLHEGDTAKLRDAFHPVAHLHSASDEKLASLNLDDWCALVEKRQSPQSLGFGREQEKILQIGQSAPDCANVTLVCAAPGKRFIDHLSLVQVGGRWWIVNKSFHAESAG